MSDELFWKIIKQIEWSRDLDYVRCEKDLKTYFENKDKSNILEFLNKFKSVKNKLEISMDNNLNNNDLSYSDLIYLSDDGLNDLLSHIIGLGESKYKKCSIDIYELSSHAKGNYDSIDGYKECFSYSLHGLYDLLIQKKDK